MKSSKLDPRCREARWHAVERPFRTRRQNFEFHPGTHQILRLTREAIVLERGRIVCQGDSAMLSEGRNLLNRWLGVASR